MISVRTAAQRGQFARILSPDGDKQSLLIGQDVCIYAGEFDRPEAAQVKLSPTAMPMCSLRARLSC